MRYFVMQRSIDYLGLVEDAELDEFSSFEKALRFIRGMDDGFYLIVSENGEAWNGEGQYIGFQGFVA